MSAILGRVNYDGAPIDGDAFQRAMAAQAMYGGDASRSWISDNIVLGHHLLQITPESIGEVQPYDDNRLVVVSDGQLLNRDDLFSQLAVEQDKRATLTDAALIALAYLRWGEGCPFYLIGEFAFALWDRQARRLFCARDHMGIRPFYYVAFPNFFAFATDIRSLLAFGDIPSDIDEREVTTFLEHPERFSTQQTFFRAIQKLPPAHQLTSADGSIHQSVYWRPGEAPKPHFKTEAEYIDCLFEKIETAVNSRVRTSFPVGSHLSGGLDSSGVTVLAARALRAQGNPLAWAYTWSPPRSEEFPATAHDERDLIDLVCQQEDVQCYSPPLDREELYRFLKEYDVSIQTVLAASDEVPILKHAASQNIRLMLSGFGGDEAVTFDGRGLHSELLLRGKWRRLARLLRVRTRPPRVWLREFFDNALLPLAPDVIYRYFTPYIRLHSLPTLANPVFAQQFPPYQRPSTTRDAIGVHRMQIALLQGGILTLRTEGWAAWSAPHHFIYTYPLLDRRLLDYALELPSDLIYRGGYLRYAYRAVMERCLPVQVAWRGGKFDTNVEAKRLWRMARTWQMLAQDVRDGLWDETIPCIDMPHLQNMLLNAPTEMTPELVVQVIPWLLAVRVAYMWQNLYN